MSNLTSSDIAELLRRAHAGGDGAVDELLPIVYGELRRLATSHLGKERCDHTLQPTALVHEAYIRLLGQRTVGWHDRTQFFAAASTVMRRVLVDHARAHKAAKRGGGWSRSPLDDAVACFEERAYDLVALNDALSRLSGMDERKSRVVELRFFGGLSVKDVARVLDTPVRTIEREWALAKAWLRGELEPQ